MLSCPSHFGLEAVIQPETGERPLLNAECRSTGPPGCSARSIRFLGTIAFGATHVIEDAAPQWSALSPE